MILRSFSSLRTYSSTELFNKGFDTDGAGYHTQILPTVELTVGAALDILVAPSQISTRDDIFKWVIGFYDNSGDGATWMREVSYDTEAEATRAATKFIEQLRDLLGRDYISKWPTTRKWNAIFDLLGIGAD